MFELIDTHPDISVQESEYIRLLGYPRSHPLEGRPLELATWAREWYHQNGKPWVYARKVEELDIEGDQFRIDGAVFTSKRLHSQLVNAEANGAFIVAVSAGRECEEKARQLWLEEKPDEYFFLEVYGSAVVEHLVASTGFRFCEWAERQTMMVLPHYSPGYPGWDITEQVRLFEVIVRQRAKILPGELQVLDSGMLSPKKSLLAVFGITSRLDKVEHPSNLIPCENCSMLSCQYRRVAYKKPLPQIESVRRESSTMLADTSANGTMPSPLTPNATYVTSSHALRKWSQERLRLTPLDNGTLEAEFRFEGTTCSNLGHPLEFLYHVRLGPPDQGYEVEYARCAPSPTDEGHRYMCEYLDKGDSFINDIAEENPLIGKPLDEILRWDRQFHPSGCFCESPSRRHKWGLVFEVIHYALTHGPNGIAKDFKLEQRRTQDY